jgi:hypothetical protein
MRLSPVHALHENQNKTTKKTPDPKLSRRVKTHERMGRTVVTTSAKARDSNIVVTARMRIEVKEGRKKPRKPSGAIILNINSGRNTKNSLIRSK